MCIQTLYVRESLLILALFVIVENHKQPECSTISQRVNPQSMPSYSETAKNGSYVKRFE